jgi:F-type H+-transporting ATPase subunit b
MESIMNIDPGLIVWTLVNFGIFLLILLKFGTKPIINALTARENSIKESIESAENARDEAKKLMLQSEEKIANAQKEMMEIISKGREQSEKLIQKATEEADAIRRQKVEDAQREIERSKDIAIKQLRNEVADLVIGATEKILEETLDKDKHMKMIDKYIEKLPNN